VLLPDSMKLRMSFLVTRPLRPVPSSCEISTPCSCAILRTSGLDFVRRRSSAVASLHLKLVQPPVAEEVLVLPGGVGGGGAGAGAFQLAVAEVVVLGFGVGGGGGAGFCFRFGAARCRSSA
jgi:hypothetical protein